MMRRTWITRPPCREEAEARPAAPAMVVEGVVEVRESMVPAAIEAGAETPGMGTPGNPVRAMGAAVVGVVREMTAVLGAKAVKAGSACGSIGKASSSLCCSRFSGADLGAVSGSTWEPAAS